MNLKITLHQIKIGLRINLKFIFIIDKYICENGISMKTMKFARVL